MNDGERIYITTTDGTTYGVSIYDIQTVLSSAESDIGGLITEGGVNPWATYKPFRSSVKGMTIHTNIASLGIGDLNGNARVPYATTVQGLIDLYTDGESNTYGSERANGWRYLLPRGMSYSEWFRFFDFVKVISSNGVLTTVEDVGYNHSADNPFGDFTCTQNLSRNGGNFVARQDRLIPVTVPEEYITIGDINDLMTSGYKMLYFGVLFVPADTSHAFRLVFNNETTITPETRGYENIELDTFSLTSAWAVDEYTAYPFLTNMAISSTARMITVPYSNRNNAISNDNPQLFPLPGVEPLLVNVFDFYIVITVHATTASQVGNNYYTDIYFTVRNNYSESITITSFMLKWRLASSEYSTARQTGEVFYDGEYRYDDSYPSGYADSSYASMLTTSRTIASGETITIPGEGLSYAGTVPSQTVNTLFIGTRYNYTDQYGSTTVRVPASTDLVSA